MLSWTQLRNPSSHLNPFINWFKSRPDRKLRPTFKPALKTDQSSSVVVGPDKRQPKTAAGKAPRLNSEVFLILVFGIYSTQDLRGLLLAGQQSWVCKWLPLLTADHFG